MARSSGTINLRLAQEAPVAYDDTFPFKAQIETAGNSRAFSRQANRSHLQSELEKVEIWIHGNGRTEQVRKPYLKTFSVGRGDDVVLNDIIIHDPPSQKWWAWIGIKRDP